MIWSTTSEVRRSLERLRRWLRIAIIYAFFAKICTTHSSNIAHRIWGQRSLIISHSRSSLQDPRSTVVERLHLHQDSHLQHQLHRRPRVLTAVVTAGWNQTSVIGWLQRRSLVGHRKHSRSAWISMSRCSRASDFRLCLKVHPRTSERLKAITIFKAIRYWYYR